MIFSPRPRFIARALPPLTLVAVLVALSSAGCENKHIGRPCSLDTQDDGGTTSGTATNVTFNGGALECPSRICVLPPVMAVTDTGSLCTADCNSDDDCSDGEQGPKGDTTDHRCESGFACLVATDTGPFCCRKFCLCKDFYSGKLPEEPTTCMPGMNVNGCPNVH
jgi:hypothetical protein